MTTTTDTTLRLERRFDATPEEVFRAWTTREAMQEWYRDGDGWRVAVTHLDVRVGGSYRVEFGPIGAEPYVEHGEYLVVDPPHRLVMSETLSGVEAPWSDTRVTVELTADGAGTRCVLTHERFPSPHHRDLASMGWPGFLDRIAALVAA
jgi:uncharacterized protein YndB with AHSA1/START domain